MHRQDYTFDQKREIIFRKINLYTILCPIYGVLKCPSCWGKMSLGHEFKKNGEKYSGYGNYLSIHIELGYKPVPDYYQNIQRIEIDHLDCCFNGGQATFENGVMICESCNKIFREFLTKEEKLYLLNNDHELMDCDNVDYRVNNGNVQIIQDGKKIFNGRDIISSMLYRREQNRKEWDVVPMYD